MHVIQGTGGKDILSGTVGDDKIYGYAGDDFINGRGGADVIYAGSGDDHVGVPWSSFDPASPSIVDGGPGEDMLIINPPGAAATLSLAYVRGFETIGLTTQVSVTLTNANAPDASTILSVQQGNVDASAVTAFHLAYWSGDGPLASSETVTGTSLSDTLYGKGVLNGGAGADTITGNGQLNGGDGDDVLQAGILPTVLDGGPGNDVLRGAPWFPGATASYADAPSGVTVNLLLTTAQDTIGAGVDTLSNIKQLIGSDFGDMLTGLATGSELDGGGGADVLMGGPGDDRFNGGAGLDTVSYANASAGVHADLETSTPQNTLGAGTDFLVGIEKLIGSNFDDVLTAATGGSTLNGGLGDDILGGGAGADSLNGGGGADTLIGSDGKDLLTGGGGADRFVFTAMNHSPHGAPDTITDFTHGADVIDLSGIDADTGAGGHQHFHLGGGGGHAGDITVTYNAGSNQTELDIWTGTHGPADGEILLNGDLHAMLTAGDFVL